MRTSSIVAATAAFAIFTAPVLAAKPASTPGNGNVKSQSANNESPNSNAPKGPPTTFPGGGATGGVFPGGGATDGVFPGGHNHPPVSGQ